MKNLILILFALVFAIAALAAERSEVLLGSAPVMSCFRYETPVTKQHAWDKKRHLDVSAYWVLLDRDTTAFLVAQPIPLCEDNKSAVNGVCPFWVRTVDRQDSFLSLGSERLRIVPCPKLLDKAYFQKLIKEKYKDELEF